MTTSRRALTINSIIPALSVCTVWALWEWSSYRAWINRSIFPPPSEFISYLVSERFAIGLGRDRVTIGEALISSLSRVAAGLALGLLFAIIAGSVLSLSNIVARFFLPLLQIIAPIAPIAWIPLALSLLGIGNTSAVFIVFMGIASILTIATYNAIRTVKPELKSVARTLGATPFQLWRYVIIPAILPQVFTLLRLNFFAAWMAVLAAEMVGLRNGLGAIIMIGRESANAKLILIGMLMIGIAGYIIDSLLMLAQRRLLWWAGTTNE